MRLPIQTYDLDDPASTARLINCYPEPLPGDARAPFLLRRCPGLDFQRGAEAGGIRAMTYNKFSNRFFAITEKQEVSWTANDSFSFGNVRPAVPANARIDFAHSPLGMVTVIEPDAYALTSSSSTTIGTQISDSDFTSRGAGDVEFLDNYMLFREPGTGRFFFLGCGVTDRLHIDKFCHRGKGLR